MIVTGAFFADAVNMADGKLNVLGGVWDHYWAGPEGQIVVNLIALLQKQLGVEEQETVTVDVHGPDGERRVHMEADMSLRAEAENGFAILHVPFKLPQVGRHAFMVGINDEPTVTIALDIRRQQPRTQ